MVGFLIKSFNYFLSNSCKIISCASTLFESSFIPSINTATNFSYLTALYPLSLVVTISGNIGSIS